MGKLVSDLRIYGYEIKFDVPTAKVSVLVNTSDDLSK